MWQYITAGSLSAILAQLDIQCGCYHRKDKYFIRPLGIIAILLPCILAGLRDYSVGTDTSGYGRVVFDIARSSDSLSNFFRSQSLYVVNVEPLYKLLIYSISRVTDSVFWEFFIIELIVYYFVYMGLLNECPKRFFGLAVFCFNMLFFPFTLNLMRQSIAMAIIFWGFKYVKRKEIKKYIMVVVFAAFIQLTAFVAIFIYPLFFICSGYEIGKKGFVWKFLRTHKALINSIIVIGSISVVCFAPQIISLMAGLKKSFGYQLVNMKSSFDGSLASFILMFLFLIPVMAKSLLRNKDTLLNFYTVVILVCIILWQLTGVSQESYRVVLYLWILIILAIPEVLIRTRKPKLTASYFLMCTVLYHYAMFAHYSVNNVYPYIILR